ncbi:MAG: iron chelate uptake ABC transporter family permease subunit [Proteobacteria bacterium]|nr:iron chelate uptake ABC transporter family permease subunit [Pseudomonadota bacterium]
MKGNEDQRVTPLKVLYTGLILTGMLVIIAFISLSLGPAKISLKDILTWLIGYKTIDQTAWMILFKIRLPRILLAGLVGFTLSLGGVVFQALLRNPLAEPFILGVSSGAAVGAIIGIFFGCGFTFGVPLLSFVGALFTILLVMGISSRHGGLESSTLLLTGVIINAFFTAVIMFFITTTSDSRLHSMLFWLYGDLSQSKYVQLSISLPFILIVSGIIYIFSRHLNLIVGGEESALQMGVEVELLKWIAFLGISLITGIVVAFSGIIGFVGLIVPHLMRMILGPDHRLLIPASSLGGAVFLIAADTLARTIISPSELPVGVITAFLGAPFFIYLLKSRGSQWTQS